MDTKQITLNITKRTVIVTQDSPGNYRIAFHHPIRGLVDFGVFTNYTELTSAIVNWLSIGSLPERYVRP